MNKKEGNIFTLTASGGLMPQEEMLEIAKTNQELLAIKLALKLQKKS